MNNTSENVAVTLSDDLYRKLRRESKNLGVSIEWLVASLVFDTVDRTPRGAAA